MRIVFMGSSSFACPSLERLLACPSNEVVGIVTQPDRPKGRRLELAPCPVKERLGDRGIPVFCPEKVNAPESVDTLRRLAPDVFVVVAYGQILKPVVLGIPPLGCINVHGSLLPKYRGAAPIQWAVAQGERVTGVTTMYMNERMDAGDIILKREVTIGDDETGGALHDRLAVVGADALADTLDLVRGGWAPRTAQDEAAATLAPKLKKTDGRIDWSLPAAAIRNRVRAFNPWPACQCELPAGSGRWIKVLAARVDPAGQAAPGTILDSATDGVVVQTGSGALCLLQVQPEGKRPMSGDAFLRGYPLRPGDRAG